MTSKKSNLPRPTKYSLWDVEDAFRSMMLTGSLLLLIGLSVTALISMKEPIIITVIIGGVIFALGMPKDKVPLSLRWITVGIFTGVGIAASIMSLSFENDITTDRALELCFLGLSPFLAGAVLVWGFIQQENQKTLQEKQLMDEKLEYQRQQMSKILFVSSHKGIMIKNGSDCPIYRLGIYSFNEEEWHKVIAVGAILPNKRWNWKRRLFSNSNLEIKDLVIKFSDSDGNTWSINKRGILSVVNDTKID